MLIDMLPTMPEFIEDIRLWHPKTYQEHFRDSVFSAKELAIEAYDHSPDKFKIPFENTINQMNDLILNTISQLEDKIAKDKTHELQDIINDYSFQIILLIDKCNLIINGKKHMTDQDSIDHYFDDDTEKLDGKDLDQSTIDDLFG